MSDLKISDMMKRQIALWEKHKDTWSPMEPIYGRNSLLWMFEEIGEVIAIIKKKGEDEIMNNPQVRDHFVEEMVDVMMYYTDTMLRYGVTAKEISEAFIKKSERNINREYNKEYKKQ